MKKLIGIVVGVFVLLIVVAMVAPMFYDVNAKVKPMIKSAVEETMNAKAEIGTLSLSTLFGVNIGIESLKIIETPSNHVLFEMKDAKLKIPFLSLLTGTLSVTVTADNPAVNLIRNKEGVLNVSTLMKAKTEAKKDESSGSGAGAAAGHFALSTDITNANITFKDEKMGFQYKIDHLNVKSHDIGTGHPFSLEVSADLAMDNKKDMALLGKVTSTNTFQINLSGGDLQDYSLKSSVDLSDLDIKYGDLFKKAKGVPLTLASDIKASKTTANINLIELNANNFKIKTSGKAENLNSENPSMDINISSNELKLDDWKKIIKPLGEFDLGGALTFNLNLSGTKTKPSYSGEFDFKNGTMKVPGLVPHATQVTAQIGLKTDELILKKASMTLGKSDMNLTGTVKDFMAPQIQIAFNSKKLDLDEMLPQKPKAEGASAESAKEDSADMEKSLQGPIAMIRENPVLRKTNMRAETKIASLVVKNADITNINAIATFKDLIFAMDNATLKAFGGDAKSNLKIDFREKKPTYSFNADVQKLDTNSAVVSQFKDLDKSITGLANANFFVKGTGVSMDDLNKNLTGKGNINVQGGTWSGLAGLKMIGEKLKSVPGAGGISNVNVSDKFRTLKSDFTIGGGKMNVVNAIMDMENSNTSLNMNGYVAFTKDMLMKGDIIAPVQNAPDDLRSKDGRGRIPFEVGGKVNSPQVNWGATLGPLTTAYAKQEGKKAVQKGVEDLKKNIQNDDVKKLLNNIHF